MIIGDVSLIRSTSIGLLHKYGYQARDVVIDRTDLGEFRIIFFNEVTMEEDTLGELQLPPEDDAKVHAWMDAMQLNEFMAVYIDECRAVIVDFYISFDWI